MQTPSPATPQWNPWPISIIAFFSVAILGCGTLITFCSRHPADLVAADYYEQEVRYQGQIERREHAQQTAQPARISYDPASKQIIIVLPPDHAQAQPTGFIQLYRPSAANLDRQIKLAADARGVQLIDARALQPGLWKVRLSWTVGQQEYFVDQQVVVGSKSS